jgi:hypothetical protein
MSNFQVEMVENEYHIVDEFGFVYAIVYTRSLAESFCELMNNNK